MPDAVLSVIRVGCLCEQIVEPDRRIRRWHTKVWAENGTEERWQRLYSIRETRKKALNDCDRWMGEFYKVQRRAMKR